MRVGAVGAGLLLALGVGLAFAQSSAPADPAPPGSAQPAPALAAPQVPLPPGTDPAQAAAIARAEADAATNQKALDALETNIGLSQDKADALRQEIAGMNGDQAKQNAALIAAGQRVKLAEIEVSSMQERLNDIATAEGAVKSRLDGADASISNMLAALERISLNPPPALIVDPSDALGSARSAMLISAVLPQLRAKADEVVADLKHLQDLRDQAQKEQDELNANFSVLQEEQLRIATLIEARKQSLNSATAQLSTQEEQALALATRATALKQVIADLTAKANMLTQTAIAGSANPQLPREAPAAIRTAFANTSRTSPAIPFETARGLLTPPVAGEDVQDFGADDGLGGLADGVSYQTGANAPVVAPADGWVIYRGPYLNYGQIVILDPGDGYTIILAGMQTLSVNLGQFLLEGEPLGNMGSHTIGRTVATGAGVSRPTLYIELRKNDQPMDPSGWWAASSNTTQSG